MAKKKTEAAAAVAETAAAVAEAEEVSEEQQAVTDAAQKVADAKKVLDEATAEHQAAVDVLAEAVKAAEVVPELGKHIFVDFGGGFVLCDAPKGYDATAPARALSLQGANVEHVSDDPATGIWQYRKM